MRRPRSFCHTDSTEQTAFVYYEIILLYYYVAINIAYDKTVYDHYDKDLIELKRIAHNVVLTKTGLFLEHRRGTTTPRYDI